jgi:hypothetical protein
MDNSLPVGSVVRVKNRKGKYVIIGKNIRVDNKKYDYICVNYPYGYLRGLYFNYFNHNELVSMVFLGDING